ncbi:MAG: TonB-dependent receptor plug domain-containing protein [Bacteroidales bacterium]|nr:TonB-dependent receptor plug domain-containing protein [Bacteroidales bacterium]
MRKAALFIILSLLATATAAAQEKLSGKVISASSGKSVPGAAIVSGNAWAVSDSLGQFSIKARPGDEATVSCIGFKTVKTPLRQSMTVWLQDDILALNEVVITATEDRGRTSVSRIGEEAIAHIQPSSVADLLELLPGGRAIDPQFASPQIVDLRSAGSSSNYMTSAMGTRFLIDGKPVSNEANLQSTPAWSALGSEYVNRGTDMRTLSTEDIESVDVIRGIASVEYGELTSGLFKITRKKGGSELRGRFKSDMSSKLLYAGKGWETGGLNKTTLNASVNFLDSRSDPRNPRQNYKRLTGSIRAGKEWNSAPQMRKVLNLSLDYTGSFDNEKSDSDIDSAEGYGPIETYRSTYNRIALGADWTLSSKRESSFFRSLALMGSATYEKDLIDRWKHVVLSSQLPLSTSLDEGAHDGVKVPARYDATLKVDGRPVYLFADAVANFRKGNLKFKSGLEWNYSKNLGKGSIYDTERPLSTSMGTRPRPYNVIPGTNNLSAFAEANSEHGLGKFKLEWMLGARVETMFGAGKEYKVNFRPYVDPRANIRLNLPKTVLAGHMLDMGFYTGAGWHTMFPTMDQLYPMPVYGDCIQLNYWPNEEELRRVNFYVYKIDPTNYGIDAARNFKGEVGFDASWNGFTFSIDWFHEDMRSGFRNSSEYTSVIYRKYDATAIDKSTLTGPPALEGLPSVADTLLTAYGITSNGSRSMKQGVEFTLGTKRIESINTRIYINGAYFRTVYTNSIAEYERPSQQIAGKPYPYIGIYDHNDGRLYESFNTNFMFDTQVPRLGLIFSTSLQCTWFTGSRSEGEDEMPVAYIDKELVRHEYTSTDAADGIKSLLKRTLTPTAYVYDKVPFGMNVNFKVSKKVYRDKGTFSLFVNKIFDVHPDYKNSYGATVRRSVQPYFGMELDFRI